MIHFNSLLQKILNWDETLSSPLHIHGPSVDQWTFILNNFFQKESDPFLAKSHLIITASNDEADDLSQALASHFPLFFYPGLEASPYSGVISSEKSFYDRLSILSRLKKFKETKEKFILVTSFEALSLRIPPLEFFDKSSFPLSVDDIIPPLDLAKKLVALGYSFATSVEEPGTFIQKGQIFDIYPVGSPPVRLSYFDDLIEAICEIDLETQKSIKENIFTSIVIGPAAGVFTTGDFPVTLRENIPQVGPSLKSKFDLRKALFTKLSEGQLFENYPVYTPLFFKQSSTLFDFINTSDCFVSLLNSNEIQRGALELAESLRVEFENSTGNNNESLLPHFEQLYDFSFFKNLENQKVIMIDLFNLDMDNRDVSKSIDLRLVKTKSFLNQHINPALSKPEYISKSLSFLKEHFQFLGNIYFSSYSESSKAEIKHLIDLQEYPGDLKARISFLPFKVLEGFYYEHENFLIITDGDLFASKKTKVQKSSKVDLDLFAEQIATLKIGDYVIHSEYGIGEYMGLEALDIAGDKTDFLILKYAENDKVYVPVYKLNQIQKHADALANLKKDSLRTNKFQALKSRARASVKTLAFDLLKLQAERQSASAYAFSEPDHLYKEFELAFPFEETPDQARAIEEVLEAMQKPSPMDFLVCGDVGFGKTEVAMRAAFKAVEDKKQVAVLVPTTILALQHFNSFTKRFADFPVRIEFISRFKSPKESKEILERAERGQIDILIGTHKILSDKLKFRDLGLVIVDEEQRFGVGHKEKLKLMKASFCSF
jgi:transcription-repair coupling factor (superfamily II helicase)